MYSYSNGPFNVAQLTTAERFGIYRYYSPSQRTMRQASSPDMLLEFGSVVGQMITRCAKFTRGILTRQRTIVDFEVPRFYGCTQLDRDLANEFHYRQLSR